MTTSGLRRRKYLILLLTVISSAILQSFTHRVGGPVVSDVLVTLAVVAVFVVVFTGWRERAVAFAFAAAGIIINWCHYLWIPGEHPMLLGIAHHVLLFVFLGFAVVVILRNIFEGTVISGDAVLGGLCGYIIAAAMWANLYAIIEILLPGSFALSPALAQDLPIWQGRRRCSTTSAWSP